MQTRAKNVKPFVKWAGGKGQLLQQYRELYPSELKNGKIKTYIEPFVGGGAVLFDIMQNYHLENIIINDINKELMNTYRCIKSNVERLIDSLSKVQDEYLALSKDDRKSFYYMIRSRYNSIMLNNHIDIEKAVDFIFLNRTCFNSLYRVNMNGKFNVPIGRYKNPLICDAENLRNLNIILKDVLIMQGDYSNCFRYIDGNTFIFLDPPYRALNSTAEFNFYSMLRFRDREQIELAKYCKQVSSSEVYLMISNSDPKNANPQDYFFDELYMEFNINRIQAKRVINSKSELRSTSVSELLITNYK